jgi:hypothetical protein
MRQAKRPLLCQNYGVEAKARRPKNFSRVYESPPMLAAGTISIPPNVSKSIYSIG